MTRTPPELRPSTRRIAAAAITLLIIGSLAACAPEPTGADVHGKNPIESGEAEYPEPPKEAYAKNVELPASFPTEFPRPASLTIDDTGEREPGTWFVVFKATDQAVADAAWASIVTDGGFTVSDSTETTEGGITATLSSAALTVTGTTIPADDGTVLLSYDITASAG